MPDGQRWVVIGAGLNVHPGSAPEGSASLVEVDPATPPRIGDVWAWMAPALIHGVQAFATQGFAPLQAAYAQRDVLRGQASACGARPGQYPADGHPPTQTGVAQGVDAQGALLVHTRTGCAGIGTAATSAFALTPPDTRPFSTCYLTRPPRPCCAPWC